MNLTLNQDVLQGKWKQLRGRVKQRWGKLTDNQLDQINGNYERLVGIVQENYGIAREKAQEQVNGFIDGLKNSFGGQS
jgi:uncharacterized protein YjbJ (UPF0337 family)